ncbi:hypothetical protein JS533_008400 [Bifidobacterium amazonense]|uniref:Peptidoglycan-binding protein n=1 Tax=Bifidobacterium amazonense TaxID=2809027 RepID=A0ABS9VW03_9BIFI|nr:hypothetical protein [Bifidobacterium amazonense]MCH9276286.1 hypothetical protein [Bifidobacterium amazonense]
MLAVACLMLGAGVTAIVMAPRLPQALSGTDPNASIAIEHRQTDDARTITIDAEEVSMPPVTAPRSGMITQSDCKPGAVLKSGTSIMRINGRSVLMLATEQPFWRDLSVGDRGDDVASLNKALTMIGVGDISGDTVTDATIQAFRTASEKAGNTLPDGYTTIDTGDVAWLPVDGTSVSACPATVGQDIARGQTLVELPAAAGSAKAESLPTGVASGERVVLAGDQKLDISETGDIDDLAAFSRSAPFLSSGAQQGVRKVSVQWALKTPVDVGVVPASAIGTMDNGQPCVVIDGDSRPVRIIGSMLGRSYVQTTDGEVPDGNVRLKPDAGGCS